MNSILQERLNESENIGTDTMTDLTTIKKSISDYYNTLAANLDNFKSRPGQQEMIDTCADAIHNGDLLAVEAGTGVGKTFAYILASLPFIKENDKRLYISTNTVALQSQLFEKDLPFVIQQLEPELKVELAKGGSRYFCPARAGKFLSSPNKKSREDNQENDLFNDDHLYRNASTNQANNVKALFDEFNSGKFNGDLDTATVQIDNKTLPLIYRDRKRCNGARACASGDTCPYYLQQERIKEANIVVTNHALLSQAMLRGLNILPANNDTICIIDEAHQLPDVLRDANANIISTQQAKEWSKAATKLEKAADQLIRQEIFAHSATDDNLFMSNVASAASKGDSCFQQLTQLSQFLSFNYASLRGPKKDQFDNIKQWVLPPKTMEKSLTDSITQSFQAADVFHKSLFDLEKQIGRVLLNLLSQATVKQKKAINQWTFLFKHLMNEAKNAKDCLARYVTFADITSSKIQAECGLARWIYVDNDHPGEFIIGSNITNIAQQFQQTMVKPFMATVATSATLQALGDFDFFNQRIGLIANTYKNKVKTVASPFNYANAHLSVPLNAPFLDKKKHPGVVATYIAQAVARHSAILVLFTSNEQLNACYQQCPEELKALISCQHDYSKTELIKRHKQRIDNHQTSILFGVNGLSEGVDLQREYLTCVIIEKLPFPAPSDPVQQYEILCLKAKNQNDFFNLSLPLCSRQLIQSCGRLIRSEEDYGEIIILDPRVNSKRYGTQLLHSLPMYNGNDFYY